MKGTRVVCRLRLVKVGLEYNWRLDRRGAGQTRFVGNSVLTGDTALLMRIEYSGRSFRYAHHAPTTCRLPIGLGRHVCHLNRRWPHGY